MQKKILYTIFILAFIVGLDLPCLAGMSSNSYCIPTSVLSGGGSPMSSDSYLSNATLGQSSPVMDPYDPPISTSYKLFSGFWYTIEAGVMDDTDGDGFPDDEDNCPEDYNPDQLNSDDHNGGDICDVCPADNTDTCDTSGSEAGIINETGGTVGTPDGNCTIEVPAGAVEEETTFSITDSGSGYELETDLGDTQSVLGVQLGCGAESFSEDVTVRLEWIDENPEDGVVDGTTFSESEIFIVKDSEVITTTCISDDCDCLNPPDLCSACGCDLDDNYFEIDVTTFSEFVLAVPFDSDGDSVLDNFDGVEDNCPETPNGPALGTCVMIAGDTMVSGYQVEGNFISCDEDADCAATGGLCQMEQGDYNGSGCGDVCECEGEFEGDNDVDGMDALTFKSDFGRQDCDAVTPCNGNFNCDSDVDGLDAIMFKINFGRRDCPSCAFSCY